MSDEHPIMPGYLVTISEQQERIQQLEADNSVLHKRLTILEVDNATLEANQKFIYEALLILCVRNKDDWGSVRDLEKELKERLK